MTNVNIAEAKWKLNFDIAEKLILVWNEIEWDDFCKD